MFKTKEELKEKVINEYNKHSVELSSAYFDFDVSMPVKDILQAYADLQEDINGDHVIYPNNVKGTYSGNCQDFLVSCNAKPGYLRLLDDIELDFVF